ncbi:MAG: GAF domain-containing protein, partial [Candidatus Sumerlaeaceae bacterium]|nr:GAF domain-containing protein [Candidatus Sumerlaeaceae bacterium]
MDSRPQTGVPDNDQTPGTLQLTLAITNRRLRLMAQISRIFLGSAPLAEMATELTHNICEAFDVDASAIRVLEGDELVLLAETGIPNSRAVPRMSTSDGIAAQLVRDHRPIMIENVATHPSTAHLHKAALQENRYVFLSYAGAPMMIGNQVVGVLGIFSRSETRKFEESDLDYLQIVANHVAVAITGHRLYEELDQDHQRLKDNISRRERAENQLYFNTMHDLLTGLPNRR